jgi:hypothetical protein
MSLKGNRLLGVSVVAVGVVAIIGSAVTGTWWFAGVLAIVCFAITARLIADRRRT